MPDAPLWLSVAEAARLTGLSDAHVRRHAPVERVGRRVLVPAWWVHHPRHGEETDGRRGERLSRLGWLMRQYPPEVLTQAVDDLLGPET